MKKPPKDADHPIQPIICDQHGVVRFKSNGIVRYLLDHGGFDMNAIARLPFDLRDREQFAQLIGYSVSGFGDLSYVRPDTVAEVRSRRAEPEEKTDFLNQRSGRVITMIGTNYVVMLICSPSVAWCGIAWAESPDQRPDPESVILELEPEEFEKLAA